MSNCEACGDRLNNSCLTLKCVRCKAWINNNAIFARLVDRDIALIKERDLVPATPSFLSFQATEAFYRSIRSRTDRFQEAEAKTGDAYFSAYLHATLVSTAARYKTQRADDLRERVGIEFIANALAVLFFDIGPAGSHRIQRSRADPLVSEGLKVFRSLQRVKTMPLEGLAIAEALCEIVYGEANIFRGTYLFLQWSETLFSTKLQQVYSRYFIVDEDDFQWQTVATDRKAKEILERWLGRFD